MLELAGVVAGYGLAAALARGVFPDPGSQGVRAGLPVALGFCWLGLAMSGPFVLALRRRGLTRVEVAWAAIGGYWILVASGLAFARLAAPPYLGLVPLAFLPLLRLLSRDPAPESGHRWTHRAALVVLATWPIAWGALVLGGSGWKWRG